MNGFWFCRWQIFYRILKKLKEILQQDFVQKIKIKYPPPPELSGHPSLWRHNEKQRLLTEAGRAVEGHIPDDSGTKTRPHQQELLSHLLQATGPLSCHLERTFPWEKRGKGEDAGAELTPGSVLGLNPQERKTCQQVNYLICPQGHAFLLNYCLGGARRCQGDQILQAHIWHIMDANGKLEDIINWEDCSVSGSVGERRAAFSCRCPCQEDDQSFASTI